jgi:flagellar biosynthesis protein FlhG
MMDALKATVVFEGRQYDVTAVSADGLQVECAAGFADETVARFGRGGFEFVLRDPATDAEIELVGELVRSERTADGHRVGTVWIATKAKPGSSSTRPAGGLERRTGTEDAIGPGVGRMRAGTTLAVGGGKGGVGKTIVSVNLALALSRRQKTVTLLDGDFSNCNCNTLLGITRVEHSLEDYLRRERSLAEITIPTAYPGLRLVCGAQTNVDAVLAVESSRLLNDIRQIDADALVIDLGAGVSDETLDLYRLADEKIIVVTPQVTSLQNAYGFVKSAFFHDVTRAGGAAAALLDQAGSDAQKLHALIGGLADGHPARRAFAAVLARQSFKIVANMVDNDRDLKVIQNLQQVVGQYLHIDNAILGTLATSDEVSRSVNRVTPFVAQFPDLPGSREMARMAGRLAQPAAGRPS